METESTENVLFIKDMTFNSKRIDDPYILEAYIPEKQFIPNDNSDLTLTRRNELIHPVGLVATGVLKYFSINGEAFNIFRARGMAVWWLRHIYNSFNWWSAYVVNAEGERKNWPMLYIGENFGSAKGDNLKEVDIVISAFENDRCMIEHEQQGGTIFAAGYSGSGGLFNSPDMYGVKLIVANKYKGCGASVTTSVKQNLQIMAKHILEKEESKLSGTNIDEYIKKMKAVVLNRKRHAKLVKTIESFGVEVILAKDDDLTPTLAVARDEIDFIIGVGGVPEAVLSALLVENLGGEMTMRLLPLDVAGDEELLSSLINWELFKKNEIDILQNFEIVKPGTEKGKEVSWNKIWRSDDLARGDDMVFTASVIKENPWIRYPDGVKVPGVEIDYESGDIKVHVVRVIKDKIEIVPIIYKTSIGKYKNRYGLEHDKEKKLNILFKLVNAYSEFGLFKEARECLQSLDDAYSDEKDNLQKICAVYEYVSGLELLTWKESLTPEIIIEHFENADTLNKHNKRGPLRPKRMIKRYYEFQGDVEFHAKQYDRAWVYYKKALEHSAYELKIYNKLNSVEMRALYNEYFTKVDNLFVRFNGFEPSNWKLRKLKIAMKTFCNDVKKSKYSCLDAWLIFFVRTVLYSESPSFQMAILSKLLKLLNKLNYAKDSELIMFLEKEVTLNPTEITIILTARKKRVKFHSVIELYFVKELKIESLEKLLYPQVSVHVRNELEDSHIPLSITSVEAMECRTNNILEELREGYIEDAQEHQYSLAESYHYVGLIYYNMGNVSGTKIYYDKAIGHFNAIVQRFEGLTPVNAQHRKGDLYYELGLLFPEKREKYYKKAIDSYMWVIDEEKFVELFGDIVVLTSAVRQETINIVKCLNSELNGNN